MEGGCLGLVRPAACTAASTAVAERAPSVPDWTGACPGRAGRWRPRSRAGRWAAAPTTRHRGCSPRPVVTQLHDRQADGTENLPPVQFGTGAAPAAPAAPAPRWPPRCSAPRRPPGGDQAVRSRRARARGDRRGERPTIIWRMSSTAARRRSRYAGRLAGPLVVGQQREHHTGHRLQPAQPRSRREVHEGARQASRQDLHRRAELPAETRLADRRVARICSRHRA